MGSAPVHSSVKVGDGKKKPRSTRMDFFFGRQFRLDFFFGVGEKKTRGEVQSRVGARAIPLGLC